MLSGNALKNLLAWAVLKGYFILLMLFEIFTISLSEI